MQAITIAFNYCFVVFLMILTASYAGRLEQFNHVMCFSSVSEDVWFVLNICIAFNFNEGFQYDYFYLQSVISCDWRKLLWLLCKCVE